MKLSLQKRLEVPRLAFPLILSNLTVPLLGLTNAVVAGHMHAAYLLASVGFGVAVFDFIYWCFGFLRQGTTGFVAQAIGRDDFHEAVKIFERGIVIAVSIALLLWCATPLILWVIQRLLQHQPQLEQGVASYVHWRLWGAPATLLNYVLNAWFLGVRRTRYCLYLMIVTNGVAILSCMGLVWGLHWGIAGIALADVIGQSAGAVFGLWLCLADHRVRQALTLHIWQWRWFRSMMSVNRDLFIRTTCLMSAFFFFNTQSAHLGATVLAANTVLLNLMMLMAYGQDGFNETAEILVGNSLGQQDYSAFWSAIKGTLSWSIIVALIFSGVFLLMGHQLIEWMTSLTQVRELANQYLAWVVIAPLIGIWCFWLDGVFMGALWGREIRNAMVISLVGYFLLWWLMRSWGNAGLWFVFLSFLALRGFTLGLYFWQQQKRMVD